jgi:hypothetical protein
MIRFIACTAHTLGELHFIFSSTYNEEINARIAHKILIGIIIAVLFYQTVVIAR